MAVAGDAHDVGAGHAGGFLGGAECAACRVCGEVLLDAGDASDAAEVSAGGGVWVSWGHLAAVALEDLHGEVGEWDFEGLVGFFGGDPDVDDVGGVGDDLDAPGLPIGPSEAGLGGEYKPVECVGQPGADIGACG